MDNGLVLLVQKMKCRRVHVAFTSFYLILSISVMNICINRSVCHRMDSKCLAFVAAETKKIYYL